MARILRLTPPNYMRGPDVVALQRLLTKKGFPCDIDGVFGPKTAARVVSAKKRLHYPTFRQLPIAGATFNRLLKLLPDAHRLQLPQFFTPTHVTAGLPNFPAVDLFVAPGT